MWREWRSGCPAWRGNFVLCLIIQLKELGGYFPISQGILFQFNIRFKFWPMYTTMYVGYYYYLPDYVYSGKDSSRYQAIITTNCPPSLVHNQTRHYALWTLKLRLISVLLVCLFGLWDGIFSLTDSPVCLSTYRKPVLIASILPGLGFY